jgi:hypothetical protein
VCRLLSKEILIKHDRFWSSLQTLSVWCFSNFHVFCADGFDVQKKITILVYEYFILLKNIEKQVSSPNFGAHCA